ncbi:MAG: hypothetical protein RIM84_04915 [Alphaproteobacteria bacterium]
MPTPAARQTARRNRPASPRLFDAMATDWQDAGQPGFYHKMVYGDREAGRFLGLIRIDPMMRSGLHQHQGVATSYFLAGTISDYGGTVQRGQAGINLAGDTHDATTYDGCTLAARLEGPVIYVEADQTHELHLGATQAALPDLNPERRPDINITVDGLPEVPTSLAGISRATIFDYAGTPDDRRWVSLRLQPGASLPAHVANAPLDWFVVAGDLKVSKAGIARAGSFVVADAGCTLAATSRGGCHLLAWSEAPVSWARGNRPDPYGF